MCACFTIVLWLLQRPEKTLPIYQKIKSNSRSSQVGPLPFSISWSSLLLPFQTIDLFRYWTALPSPLLKKIRKLWWKCVVLSSHCLSSQWHATGWKPLFTLTWLKIALLMTRLSSTIFKIKYCIYFLTYLSLSLLLFSTGDLLLTKRTSHRFPVTL